MTKLLTVLTLLFALVSLGRPGIDWLSLGNEPRQLVQADAVAVENPVYLPLLTKPKNTPTNIGVEIHYSGNVTDTMTKVKDANIKWARTSAISWKDIEPVRTNPPSYNWNVVNESHLIGLTSAGLRTLGIVRWAPSWAQRNPPWACGQIAENALDAFAQFMGEVAARYSKAPYDIHHWEIGNEPDVPPLPDDYVSWFGCWGDMSDPYFGGGYYARMLEKVYPAIKAADPTAQVVIGGLLLDCDPTNPPPGKDCLSSKFLEGILINNGKYDGGNYFDIVSYHGHLSFDGTLKGDENFPSWAARGGLVLGKANFLREVLAKYGVSKPIYHTEGSLTCPETYSVCQPAPGASFFEAQADYVVWLYVRNWANSIGLTSWYELEGPGWRNDGILDGNGNPRPVYYALQFLTNELSSAKYSQQIFQYPALRAYEFTSPAKKIWVVWSPDENSYTIDVPTGTMKVLDKYGYNVAITVNKITVKSPVYIEITP